jgi:Ser/Thr protein kinase RdoA (MazF antagonist)
LVFEGSATDGEVGAAYVRWPDGRPGVLTMGSPVVGPLLDVARSAGVPTPVYELDVPDGDLVYLVQTRLPGSAPRRVDADIVAAMLAINDRLRGLLSGRDDLVAPSLFLTHDGPGFCLHEPLRRYDRRTARILDWIHEVGQVCDDADGDDLVHLDFHAGNVLVTNRTITGVIDWDGAARGDGRLDLVTLRFDLAQRASDLLGGYDAMLRDRLPADRLRAYWAHMALRQIDWSIRHHPATTVDFWVDAVAAGME